MVSSELTLADKVEAFASSDFAFENLLVWAISRKMRSPVRNLNELLAARKAGYTISLRGMEKFNLKTHLICEHLRGRYDHIGSLNCTVDISQVNSPSPPWHNDPDGNWLKVLRGTKTIEYDNGAGATLVDLGFDDDLYLSPGSRFRAVNTKASVMLVVRLGRFWEDLT